jgi:hypothetical protein
MTSGGWGIGMTADWLRGVLVQHDPLAVWPPTAGSAHDYEREAELALQGAHELQGLRHAQTLVADALDQVHPGIYRDAGQNAELAARIGRIAHDIWDWHGQHLRQQARGATTRRTDQPAASTVTELHALTRDLVLHEDRLVAWLRNAEAALGDEAAIPWRERTGVMAFNAAVPRLIEVYTDAASEEQRGAIRAAVSRFRLVLYGLSMFAARQWHELPGPDAEGALRRALIAESILDLGLDWRDELLMLRDLRQRADSLGLPFEDAVRQAAALSTPRTARFLLGVL